MTQEKFNEICDDMLERCQRVLCSKANEYATEDRLHNFKVAAKLEGITPEQALAGMMAKHTVSVYDMIKSAEDYDNAVWNEKIGDSINYLILLRALIEEARDSRPEHEKFLDDFMKR